MKLSCTILNRYPIVENQEERKIRAPDRDLSPEIPV